MRLVCPVCGCVASAEAWTNDVACRDTMAGLLKLPSPVADVVLGYMGLFRPGKRGLSWKKAKRITGELSALLAPGHVQVRGQVARPCPASVWAKAMEEMVNRRDSLNTPMPNHNYLKKIAWDLADKADSAVEKTTRSMEAQGQAQKPSIKGIDPLQAVRDKWDAEHSSDPSEKMPIFQIKGM